MFALNMYSVQYTADSKKGCRHQPSIQYLDPIELWAYKNPFHSGWTQMQETTLKQRSSLARHVSRNCCYVWDPIYAGETRNVLQLIRSLYPTNLLLSFRSTLSLQRHFLTATLSFIDRGCYLEKQKNRGGGRTGKGGRGRQEKKKQIARQQSKQWRVLEKALSRALTRKNLAMHA